MCGPNGRDLVFRASWLGFVNPNFASYTHAYLFMPCKWMHIQTTRRYVTTHNKMIDKKTVLGIQPPSLGFWSFLKKRYILPAFNTLSRVSTLHVVSAWSSVVCPEPRYWTLPLVLGSSAQHPALQFSNCRYHQKCAQVKEQGHWLSNEQG